MKKTLYKIQFDNQTIKVTIPESLITHLKQLNLKQNLLHKIYVFVSILIYYSLNKKYKDSFIPLHSNILIKLFSSYYLKFISKLKELSIIQVNNQYLTSKDHPLTAISKKYKLYNSSFYNSKLIQISFSDIKLTKRLNKLYSLRVAGTGDVTYNSYKPYKQLTRERLKNIFSNSKFPYGKSSIIPEPKETNSNIVTDAKYDNLKFWLNSIEFDIPSAKLYLEKNKNKFTYKQINSIEHIINLFQTKEPLHLKQCKAGRLFSVVTQMPKVLRQFLKYKNFNGEYDNLVMLDISNFQPFIINKYLYDYNLQNNKDSKQWYKLTSSGKIYQYLVELYNKQKNIKRKVSKQTIKQRLVSIINSQTPEPTEQTILYKLLVNKFPSIINLFKQIKEQDYKQMSYQLQSFESKLMIQDIAIPFSYLFILTIHDGVIIREVDVNTYQRYFMDAFSKHFSRLPALKQTNLIGGGECEASCNLFKQTIQRKIRKQTNYKYNNYNNNYNYKTKEDYIYSYNYLHNILYNQETICKQ